MNVQRTENAIQHKLDKMEIDNDTYMTLKNSIFPGVKDDSIHMAVSYCRAAKLDILHKPVHIVPMSVRNPITNVNEWRDIVMPGIALYRIKASRSGTYAGKTEPEFGPDVTEDICGITVTYPQWCRVTIKKIINNQICEFTAREFWKENFASKKSGEPNAMWVKRPYAQLAKCTEAQGLRMAFPELTGGMPTAEEMEGKILDSLSAALEDHKAMSEKGSVISEHEVIMLRDKMKEAESEEINICQHFKIESIESMTFSDFSIAMRMLQRKIDKKRAVDDLEINQLFTQEKE